METKTLTEEEWEEKVDELEEKIHLLEKIQNQLLKEIRIYRSSLLHDQKNIGNSPYKELTNLLNNNLSIDLQTELETVSPLKQEFVLDKEKSLLNKEVEKVAEESNKT
jgi:hypothetical protein